MKRYVHRFYTDSRRRVRKIPKPQTVVPKRVWETGDYLEHMGSEDYNSLILLMAEMGTTVIVSRLTAGEPLLEFEANFVHHFVSRSPDLKKYAHLFEVD